MKTKPEKGKAVIDSVAYSNGKGGQIDYAARRVAASKYSMKKGGK